jgi:GTP 3',8-cyclase
MTYLRLSVTDRCNFRCGYCSPAHWGGKKDLLVPEEFERIVSVFASMGIRRVRLTGGEPLIRPDILEVARRVAAVPGVERVAITTNASHLERLARPLREAGVSQLNMSLDTLSEATFRAISKQGDFASILRGIEAAAVAGYESLKLNVVVMRGVNDGEAPELVRWAHARGITPRFIELMPFGQGKPVPTAELIERIQEAAWRRARRATGGRPRAGWASSPRSRRTSAGGATGCAWPPMGTCAAAWGGARRPRCTA